MNFRNSAAITASHTFLRRIFGGGENFGGSAYSASARKSATHALQQQQAKIYTRN